MTYSFVIWVSQHLITLRVFNGQWQYFLTRVSHGGQSPGWHGKVHGCLHDGFLFFWQGNGHGVQVSLYLSLQ